MQSSPKVNEAKGVVPPGKELPAASAREPSADIRIRDDQRINSLNILNILNSLNILNWIKRINWINWIKRINGLISD